MKDLDSFKIEVSRAEDQGLRVWLYIRAPESAPGLNWINFLLCGDEAIDLFAGKRAEFVDGYHRLSAFGEDWLFFDTPDRGREDSGELRIQYRRVIVPRPVRDEIAWRITTAIERHDAQDPDKWGRKDQIELDLSGDLEAWARDYGQGKGSIQIDSADPGMAGTIAALEESDPSFARCWDRIKAIALNTTHARTDVAPIRIHRESERAFLWTAGRLTGGLIDHGVAGIEADWSIHT